MMSGRLTLRRQCGTSLIEVLVTVVILATGMLGVAGLQSRLQISEMEAYQRSQAMILLEDMSHRLSANRNNAASYKTTSGPVGGSTACPSANTTLRDKDIREWCMALQGAGEKSGTSSVGAMVGGRGCVELVSSNEYMITVAWQGMAPVSAPNSGVACGKDLYDGGQCADDKCRRVVTTIIRFAPLTTT
jgi:type IV pilus assembly protein PilV